MSAKDKAATIGVVMPAPRSQSPAMPSKGNVKPKLPTINGRAMSLFPTNERGSPESVIIDGRGSDDETYNNAMPGPSHTTGRPAGPSHTAGRPSTHTPLTRGRPSGNSSNWSMTGMALNGTYMRSGSDMA